jgi:hypothetical protein
MFSQHLVAKSTGDIRGFPPVSCTRVPISLDWFGVATKKSRETVPH